MSMPTGSLEAYIIRTATELIPSGSTKKLNEETLEWKTRWDYLTHFISELFPFFKHNFKHFVNYHRYETKVTKIYSKDVVIISKDITI